jgi:outer membrane usher protein FimD/PapC
LPNVRLRSDNYAFRDKTDEAGTALITGLDPYQETPVRIDTETLEDPYWKAADPNIAVLPRPGSVVKLEFPVYETGEVDGAVEMERGGQRVPLPGIRLQVVDASGKVVSQALSGYDGSFFVQGVRLGSYTLRPDPEQLARLHLAAVPPQAIALTHDNPGTTAGTITLAHDASYHTAETEAPRAVSASSATAHP